MSISKSDPHQIIPAVSTTPDNHINKLSWRDIGGIIVVLFKLRIVFLLLMAATGGAFIASAGRPDLGALLLLWLTGGSAAAGASALNQFWERNSDGNMGRTRQRPLVTGAIRNPGWVPYVGMGMILIPSLAVLPFNAPLAFFLLLGAIIYVGIYTIWLKPRTLLNIVIGGAAGSAAVLSGAAAVHNWQDTGALVLASILFLWTPFHFWSLALLYREEYARSEVPMLPVNTSPRQAAWWVMSHTLPTAVSGLLLVLLPTLGWVYLIPVLIVTLDLIWKNIRLIRQPTPARAKKLFLSSNVYLLILLLAICIGATAASFGG